MTINNPIKARYLFLTILFGMCSVYSFSQFTELAKKIDHNDSLNSNIPREKLFIHYDRPFYKVKDTLWIKGYVLAATDNAVTDSTGIAYIEVINTANEIVKRTAAPCYWGRFQSNIILTDEDFPQGTYVLRAYTNWMRNFGDSLFFESRFTVTDPASAAWNAHIQNIQLSGNRISLAAVLTTGNLNAIANKKINIKIRAKNRALLRIPAITDNEGNLYIDTLLKNAVPNKKLLIEIADKNNLMLQIPVKASDQSSIDLQFLPEGGPFIVNKKQQLGFKAVNVYGRGTTVKGVIKDDHGLEITSFATLHKGMGVVAFAPQPDRHYTAYPENGQPVRIPDASTSGTLLHVNNDEAADSISVIIDGTPDLRGKTFFFTATARGISLARGPVVLSAKARSINIAKTVFPSGITSLTLYDSLMRPMNERAIFIWHKKDPLQIQLVPDKKAYGQKDSVSLLLTVKDATQQPVSGSFSLAVIDTSQVKINDLKDNLLSYMLLTSDLKGTIEDPYYYFQDPVPGAADVLMLTQGWVQYQWSASGMQYEREREFKISGKATNIFNKPFSNTHVNLFGKIGQSDALFMDTLTNKEGVFTFTGFPYFTNDSVSMVISARNKKGKAFNIGVELKEPHYPDYTGSQTLFEQQNILLDTATAAFINKQAAIINLIKKNGEYLDEVVVKANLKISGSKNLNKDGGADQVIYEKTLQKTPKATLLDVLLKEVKGFHMGSPPKSNILMYMVNTNMARFIIDGVDLKFFFYPSGGQSNEYLLFLDSYLKYFSAEDIKGIEIMNYPKHNSSYRSHFLSIEEQMNTGPVTVDYSFIEITTQTGAGPFLRKTPGMYLYKPVVPVISRQFYSPRYTSPDEKTVLPDMRATVYWNPEVITDRNGKAVLSFYTTENKSNYMVIVQGTNLAGGLGVLYQPLIVNGQ